MVRITTEDGREWETGIVKTIKEGEWFLHVIDGPTQAERDKFDVYLLLKPITKQHTKGGVVFEETGEVRKVREGEWFKDGQYIGCWDFSSPSDLDWVFKEYPILVPVEIVR